MPGVDGVTWEQYQQGLDGRLADLHSRIHRGIVQQALSEVLNEIPGPISGLVVITRGRNRMR